MSLFRTAIARAQAERRTSLQLPDSTRIERAAAAIPNHAGADSRREGRDYDAIARGLLARARAREDLSLRDLRDGAWCLWETKPALAGTPALDRMLSSIERSDRSSPARALASSFMVSFDPVREGIEAAAKVLVRKAPSMGRPWANLQATFRVFDVREGPARVAKAALGSHRSPSAVLGEHGLGALDSESGYAKACAVALLTQLAGDRSLAPERRLEMVRSIAVRNGRLIFADHGPLVANALLLPFAQTSPDETTRRTFLDVVIGLFGDPRLHPERWVRMRDAEAIVRRWLVRASLLQFLDVVGEKAERRMWVPRRAFWEAVYRADLIRDAWVVFDSGGAQRARRSFGNELRFATFSGVTPGQAVLIMTIGTGLVVEWSFSGKCIIWEQADDRDAPRLYQPTYRPWDLRHATATDDVQKPVFAISHMGSETYNWQKKVAAKLTRMTGVRLTQADYAYRP